ncbi:hypothetical protein DD604_20620 [Enterobacter cloacae]|uniref:hypothetical protein n=1 Tax=Enterobacter cloacae TaxID=550 RepID=UPI001011A1A9|nr:hypothetical protein [Enterobacter cloacae]RXX46847.1 hypothetical protein DD604_20620 [Enterobacter cloacae]
MNYKFEKSLSEETELPNDKVLINVHSVAYAVLARTLNDHIPGFGHELLKNLDRVYEQNAGEAETQLAFAQIGAMLKTLIKKES